MAAGGRSASEATSFSHTPVSRGRGVTLPCTLQVDLHPLAALLLLTLCLYQSQKKRKEREQETGRASLGVNAVGAHSGPVVQPEPETGVNKTWRTRAQAKGRTSRTTELLRCAGRVETTARAPLG